MRFSVIIPTYNRAKCVGFAIESALRQSPSPFEVIVVDDGSVDDTKSVVSGFGESVTYVYQSNRGVSAARNRGVRAAQGDWIAFLDSDDEWVPEYLERQQELLGRYPNVVASVMNTWVQPLNEQGYDWFEEQDVRRTFAGKQEIMLSRPFCAVVDHHISFVQSCVFRRDVLLTTRLFDEEIAIAEDWDVIAQMALRGSFVFSRSVGIRVIRRAEDFPSLSAQFTRSGIKTRLSWARVFERLSNEGRLDLEERRSLSRKYASNQRALGNLYLRIGDASKAQSEYRRAFKLDHSLASLGRLLLAFLPPWISRLFLFKGRHIEPGVH